mmetsp:Transcript_5812/g.13500  ORF Transcript_5812/g.13500 Transcript_5812/m.13500 type:complete len:285 (+) Transcript_5812:1998-2852(+)
MQHLGGADKALAPYRRIDGARMHDEQQREEVARVPLEQLRRIEQRTLTFAHSVTNNNIGVGVGVGATLLLGRRPLRWLRLIALRPALGHERAGLALCSTAGAARTTDNRADSTTARQPPPRLRLGLGQGRQQFQREREHLEELVVRARGGGSGGRLVRGEEHVAQHREHVELEQLLAECGGPARERRERAQKHRVRRIAQCDSVLPEGGRSARHRRDEAHEVGQQRVRSKHVELGRRIGEILDEAREGKAGILEHFLVLVREQPGEQRHRICDEMRAFDGQSSA